MRKSLGIAVLFFAFFGVVFAQNYPANSDWQEIRDHQPASLHLKITLSKPEFVQGEKIEATLEYSNDDPAQIYELAVGTDDPGGIFCAEDANGRSVGNPREWFLTVFPYMDRGMSFRSPLGRFATTLRVNRDVRFDQPGTYSLFAEATVLKKGASLNPETWIVSDKVPIKIVPLTPDKEKQVIAEALGKIGTGDSRDDLRTREGLDELNDLQTPAAREAEMPFLAKPSIAWLAGQGFLGAVDPAAESTRILAAVQSGKLVLGSEGIFIYCAAKAFGAVQFHSTAGLSEKELRDWFKLVNDAESKEKARKEVKAFYNHLTIGFSDKEARDWCKSVNDAESKAQKEIVATQAAASGQRWKK